MGIGVLRAVIFEPVTWRARVFRTRMPFMGAWCNLKDGSPMSTGINLLHARMFGGHIYWLHLVTLVVSVQTPCHV